MDRLAAMETYVSVVDAGSFSAAAKRMDVGQPAISKTISQLEQHLGARLLLRSTRGLSTTEAGQRFYEKAKRAIKEVEKAEFAARDASERLSGKLRVSAATTFASLHILPSLMTFLERHPKLQIDLALDDRNIDLLEEGTDVALRMGSLPDSSMIARRIARSPRLVVGTPEYFNRAGVPQTPSDLSCHEVIVYSQKGGGEAWSFSQKGSEVSVAVSGRLRISAAEGMRRAVLGGMGLAVASRWMFAPELSTGAIQAVLSDWTLPLVDLWAVFPSGRLVTAKARAFVAFVEETLADKVNASASEHTEASINYPGDSIV